MSVLIKSGTRYYEIPEGALDKFRITKKQFEENRKGLSAETADQYSDCSLVDLRTCCVSKKSLGASCMGRRA